MLPELLLARIVSNGSTANCVLSFATRPGIRPCMSQRCVVSAPAGVQCTVISTERLNHARQVVESLPAEELARFDGIVAVGGDGLFQEALNGLLALRCAASCASLHPRKQLADRGGSEKATASTPRCSDACPSATGALLTCLSLPLWAGRRAGKGRQ